MIVCDLERPLPAYLSRQVEVGKATLLTRPPQHDGTWHIGRLPEQAIEVTSVLATA